MTTGPEPRPAPPLPLVMHPEASNALVLGIVALVGTLMCILPAVMGPVAWSKGNRVIREVQAMPDFYRGESEARVGRVLGIITTALLALGLLGGLFLLIASAVSG